MQIPIIIIGLFLLLNSCSNNTEQTLQLPSEQRAKEALVKVNQQLKRSEADEIKAYYTRRNWDMQTTETGICFLIYNKGKGNLIKFKEKIKIDYTLELINGYKCYNSKDKGPLEFTVGKAEIGGLNEVALLLRHGDQAKIIIPSHLGYGLTGDGELIPAKATLIYDMKVQ